MAYYPSRAAHRDWQAASLSVRVCTPLIELHAFSLSALVVRVFMGLTKRVVKPEFVFFLQVQVLVNGLRPASAKPPGCYYMHYIDITCHYMQALYMILHVITWSLHAITCM
jgi:hypothetical protein